MRLGILLFTLVACAKEPTTPAAAIPEKLTLAPGQKHFAAAVSYKGMCAPAGTVGGCYYLDLSPDGGARQVLLDVGDRGTYWIERNTIVFHSGGTSRESRFESTDGFLTLSGGYRYTP